MALTRLPSHALLWMLASTHRWRVKGSLLSVSCLGNNAAPRGGWWLGSLALSKANIYFIYLSVNPYVVRRRHPVVSSVIHLSFCSLQGWLHVSQGKNSSSLFGPKPLNAVAAPERRSRRSLPPARLRIPSYHAGHPFASLVDATLAYASRNKAGAPSLQRALVHRNRRRSTIERCCRKVSNYGPHQPPRDAPRLVART